MKIRVLILVFALLMVVRFYSTSAQTTSTTFQNCVVVLAGTSVTITCPVTPPPPPPLACTVTPALKSLQVGVAMAPLDISGNCSGGVKPYTFSAVSFPAGITISPAGVISGTPQTAGTFTLTWKATDSAKTAQIFEQRVILNAKN